MKVIPGLLIDTVAFVSATPPVAGLIIDNFAGGGGASTGIEAALGRSIDIAINHDPEAVAMHAANHPGTLHYCQSVWRADPEEVCAGRPVDLAWFSPDCKHFSKAKGGKPVEKGIRDLAWVVVLWAQRVRPKIIMLENVEEFRTWGPLDDDGTPIAISRGETFEEWLRQLRRAGYKVEHRELRACDFGAPTSRKRLFVIARSDGLPIVWPKPTHSKGGIGGLIPWRTAADIIDWSIACPSIFERQRPLAEATCRRIAHGIVRYVVDAVKPFIVPNNTNNVPRGIDEPVPTVTTGNRNYLVSPLFARTAHGEVDKSGKKRGKGSHGIEEPFPTVTASQDSALVSATLIQMGYGEREGQAPRALDIEAPLGTIVAGGNKHAVVAAFMAQHYTGQVGRAADAPVSTIVHRGTQQQVVVAHMAQHNTMPNGGIHPGRDVEQPVSTVTSTGAQQQIVASSLIKLRGTCKDGQPVDQPSPTITAGGWHVGEVRAFLVKYYGAPGNGQAADVPLHTVTVKERFAAVTVDIDGETFAIADIGMRMLSPRELFRAQGFPDSYIIDPIVNGKPMTKTSQIARCGNSVCPPLAEALVRANAPAAMIERLAA